ncbi:protein kinase domain-containing protein [Kitasatospora sp. NBC_00458]|uniref:protein kinase domain-containing protein n=1 Tax=Kitasatospora sp. NBC_00458 TaxID=2903568 RepID=UPI002E1915B0
MNTGGPETRLIDDRFELLERLGGGGMGLVWRARDTMLHREVALKEVRPPDPAMAAADPAGALELRERVLREARALARLQHPNVAVIHHIVDTPGHPHPWLVMELVAGGSLADRITRGPLTVPEAARIGRGVLSALRAAHTAGIQHRDVKPGNVLLRTDGTPVLTDFGIAAMQDSTALTATGALIGSPEYIAPERIRGEEGNPSSDLWSLGMTLYVAVEGHHPLRRATTLATLAAVLDEPLPPATRSGPLAPVLAGLLARDPALRPDADQLDRALAAAELGATAAAGQSATAAAPAAAHDRTLLDPGTLAEPRGAAAERRSTAAEPTDREPTDGEAAPQERESAPRGGYPEPQGEEAAPHGDGPATAAPGSGEAPDGPDRSRPPVEEAAPAPRPTGPTRAPRPARPPRRRRTPVLATASVAALALAAALAWNLLPDRGDDDAGSGAAANGTTRPGSSSPSAAGTGAAAPPGAATASGNAPTGGSTTGAGTAATGTGGTGASAAPGAAGVTALPVCTSSQVTLELTASQASYPSQEKPGLVLTVRNTAAQDCRADLGRTAAGVTVTAVSGERVWSSADCPDDRGGGWARIPAGDGLAETFTWDRSRSKPQCAPAERTPAPAGNYLVVADLSGVSGAPLAARTSIQLRG